MLAFRGAVEAAVLRIAVEEVALDGAALGSAPSMAASGDLGRAEPLPLGLGTRKGEFVLPVPGVLDLEGGLLGRLIVGLSQEEKKSSSFSPAGVLLPLVEGSISVTTTSLGNLCMSASVSDSCICCTYCLASACPLLVNSSLYLVAAIEVYLVFGSLLASAAEPPCD